ncbi:MAG: hypothetical protein FJ039_09120 [Chloroflexi bacterium]|nr:hypothetical protein [Chloroflexota bacterium]
MVFPRAQQTRDIDFLVEFLRRVQKARETGDYQPVAALIHPKALLRTHGGEKTGVDPIVNHLKTLAEKPYKAEIVAPKGGLATVLITPITVDTRAQSHEQVYRIRGDMLIELIDMGRTPEMVFRPMSQPN